MKRYSHILLGLELNDECDDRLLSKLHELCDRKQCEITLVHAIEHLSSYGAAYGVSAGVDVEEELRKQAAEQMAGVAERIKVPASHQVVVIGSAKEVIIEEAENRKADLIIVGSHGTQGVRLLLGSTTNAVLHRATCDVLAVRV